MQFDGAWYRRNRCVTVLWQLENERGGGYCVFGMIVSQSVKTKVPKGAVKTGRVWTHTGQPQYAVPIPVLAHSLTNLAYGADGRRYLCLDGVCYTSHYKIPEVWKARPALKWKEREVHV